MLGDAQVHRLPVEPLERERIALAMGAGEWATLAAELDVHRERVSEHFRLVISGGGKPVSGAASLDRFIRVLNRARRVPRRTACTRATTRGRFATAAAGAKTEQ